MCSFRNGTNSGITTENTNQFLQKRLLNKSSINIKKNPIMKKYVLYVTKIIRNCFKKSFKWTFLRQKNLKKTKTQVKRFSRSP